MERAHRHTMQYRLRSFRLESLQRPVVGPQVRQVSAGLRQNGFENVRVCSRRCSALGRERAGSATALSSNLA